MVAATVLGQPEVFREILQCLDFLAAGRLSASRQEIRTALLANDVIWSCFLLDLFPNLDSIPPERRPKGRKGFLRRLWLMRDFEHPVRPMLWPAALQSIAPALLARSLKPIAICFLVDVSYMDVRLASSGMRCDLDEKGKITAGSGIASSLHKLRKTTFDADMPSVELELTRTEAIDAAEALSRLVDDHQDLLSPVPVHLMLSYHVDFCSDVQQLHSRDPVILLNEPHSFFCGHLGLIFRTDVGEIWHGDISFPKPPYKSDDEQNLSLKVCRGHDLRYGCGRLDFDPSVEVSVSRREEFYEDSEDFECDEMGQCSMRLSLRFSDGEDSRDFSEVLPELLSLYAESSAL